MEIIAALAFCFNITETSVTIQNISSPIHVEVAGSEEVSESIEKVRNT